MISSANAVRQLHIMPIENRADIKICVCKRCGSRYEPKPLQSLIRCEYCQPLITPECLHHVSLHTPCKDCHRIYGRAYMRQLPQTAKSSAVLKSAKPVVRAKRRSMNRKRLIG